MLTETIDSYAAESYVYGQRKMSIEQINTTTGSILESTTISKARHAC